MESTGQEAGLWPVGDRRLAIANLIEFLLPFTQPFQKHRLLCDRLLGPFGDRATFSDFSGAVLVARRGSILLSRGYGEANREWATPNTPNTKFRIGSLSKQFTATLIMQLREQHRIDLQASICAYLTQCPESWQSVTVHHLLSHTSGIHDFTSDPGHDKLRSQHRTTEEVIGLFRDKPLEFPPGERWSYNNSGYFLLGVIIEKITGQSYENVLRELILTPIGMADTGYAHSEAVLANRASGYTAKQASVVNADYFYTGWAYAAGAMYSTVLDLYKWDQALYSDTVLSRQSLELMWTPVKDRYGYGWGIIQPQTGAAGRFELMHIGGISGFSSAIERFPNERATVIVLSNIENAAAGAIADSLASIVFGEPYTMPMKPLQSIDISIYDSYAGRYEVEANGTIEVTRDGNRLMVRFYDIPGSPTFIAVPTSRSRFLVEELSTQIEFVSHAQGQAIELILRQGKRQRTGRAIPTPVKEDR